MAIRGGRVPTLKMKPGWDAQPIAPLTDWFSAPVTNALPTVDELTGQLSDIYSSVLRSREWVQRYEQGTARAQQTLAEEKASLASLEESYADVRERLIRACKDT